MRACPGFSVVVANHNYGHLLEAAVYSVWAQDYPAGQIQLIVVDDGSTDDSRERLARLCAASPAIETVLQDNRGQAAAYAAGVARARHAWVCLMDADDSFLPHKLQTVATHVDALGLDPAHAFLCHDLLIHDAIAGTDLAQTWFDYVGVRALGDGIDLQTPAPRFPFANPSGQVFGRTLLSACLDALPLWAFRMGADEALCNAALLKATRMHYLHMPLARYRVHGGNDAARIEAGRYRTASGWRTRVPRTLHFLEQWVDLLDDDGLRSARLAYLKRLEYLGRAASQSRALSGPRVSVAVLGSGTRSMLEASLAGVIAQSHPCLEVLVPAQEGGDFEWLKASGRPWRTYAPAGGDDAAWLSAAHAAASGEYLLCLPVGDRLDREAVERLLNAMHYQALAALACGDIRLIDAQGGLLHADCFSRAGAWKSMFQWLPPFSARLDQWIFPPLGACLFRRDPLVRTLFDTLSALEGGLRAAAPALLCHAVQMVGGCVRLRETVLSRRVGETVQPTYAWLGAPTTLAGASIRLPPAEGLSWLQHWLAHGAAAVLTGQDAAWPARWAAWRDSHAA